MKYISTTQLQRNPKQVFSKTPFQIVLSNSEVQGMIVSKEAVELMESSGILEQIQEELWELHDQETIKVVTEAREGKGDGKDFNEFMKEYAA